MLVLSMGHLDALDSAPKHGDKNISDESSHIKEAMIEAELAAFEGADFLMVKPALCYLDVIHQLKITLIYQCL